MPYKIVDGKFVAETDKNYLNATSPKRELFDALCVQVDRAAQLEIANDEMQAYINEIRVALHTEKDELTIDAVKRVISGSDELRRQLEQAQRKIDALSTQIGSLVTS